MNIKWQWELPQILVVAAMFIVAAITWSTAPDRIPVHWNIHGDVDAYGGRFMGLLLLPLVALGIYLLLLFIPRLDPGRANYGAFQGPYAIIRIAVLVLLAAIYFVTHLVMRQHAVPMGVVVPMLTGLLFIVLGGVLGKVRPNWFVGVRTPWTLSSKLSWTKTHRLAGWMFLVVGVLTIATAFLDPRAGFVAIMVGALGTSLVAIVYSYVVWRSDPDKIAPAGTSPGE